MGKIFEHKLVIKLILIVALCLAGAIVVTIRAFSLQYNKSGVSRGINISIDDSDKTWVANVDGYDIYTKRLSDPYVVDIWKKQIPLAEAFKKEKWRLEDLYQTADAKKQINIDGNEGMVYYFENYQVQFLNEEYVISPIENK